MKKQIRIILVAFLLAGVYSCSHYIAPPFTDVGKIAQIKPGMKVKQVVDILGVDPYDIYYIQETGAELLSFNYRVKNRIMYVYTTVNQNEIARQTGNEDSQKSGDVYYDRKYRGLYTMFDKDGNLVSFLTTQGVQDKGELIVIGNTLKYYTDKKTNSLDSLYNKAHNPMYNSGKSLNINLNPDGSFNNGNTIPISKDNNKWFDNIPVLRRFL